MQSSIDLEKLRYRRNDLSQISDRARITVTARKIKSIRKINNPAIPGNRLEYNLQCYDARAKRWIKSSHGAVFSSVDARQNAGEPVAVIPPREKYFAYREKEAIMKRS